GSVRGGERDGFASGAGLAGHSEARRGCDERGAAPGSALAAVPALVIAAAAAAGLGWARWLRRVQPGVYGSIGHGRPHPLLVRDPQLSNVRI
ncbi:hypothetical protein AB0J67_05580, partial [Catellatospora sp. NPDC049609]